MICLLRLCYARFWVDGMGAEAFYKRQRRETIAGCFILGIAWGLSMAFHGSLRFLPSQLLHVEIS